jgi:hypothetical protein
MNNYRKLCELHLSELEHLETPMPADLVKELPLGEWVSYKRLNTAPLAGNVFYVRARASV